MTSEEKLLDYSDARIAQWCVLWDADPGWALLDQIRTGSEFLATLLLVMTVGTLDQLPCFPRGRVVHGGDHCILSLAMASVSRRWLSLNPSSSRGDVLLPNIGMLTLNSFMHGSSNVRTPVIASLPLLGVLVFVFLAFRFRRTVGIVVGARRFVSGGDRWLSCFGLLLFLPPRWFSLRLQFLAVVTGSFSLRTLERPPVSA